MFHCPKCQHVAHARTSRYLSENTKERYHQCTNISCSCTFVTMEAVDRFISVPGAILQEASSAKPKGQRPTHG
ncbi:ogr/Delta-like zinc finger family protein [Pseudocitrobacter cyperus]|uniref:Ogr/Delta-like zinc finger family protein n=1 Tax=Pseudocitrobacter cyperus TaxID=3112843 RepID=A0ABV0HJE8_9ENTR